MSKDPLAHRTTVRALFDAIVELHPAARRVYLDEHCPDPAVRAEVEELLARVRLPQDQPPADLPRSPDAPATAGPPVTAGDVIGPYRIERELGHGGMATVYLASRADGSYHQRVALKIVRPGMDTAEIRDRFRHERQTLAHLEHPNIARLLDGGTTEHGLPYFVMEYVEGEPIDRFCDRRRLSIDDRVRLFLSVCAAVGLAHQRLVVHRDLKPDNILVTSANEPKLLDFGISKLLAPDADSPGVVVRTRAFLRLMTPRYASPEQIAYQPVTTASDVYSLGVLLYELLCGRYPYERAVTSGVSIEQAIRDRQPPAPSQALVWRPAKTATVADAVNRSTAEDLALARSTTPAALQRALRGDLDTIVMRAMHKDQERRYGSVEQLAGDLQRYLDRLPVLARKDTFAYRTGKFVRRHRLGVAAACIALLSLVAGLTAAVWQARVAAVQRDRARAEARKAEQMSRFLHQAFAFADPSWFGASGNSKGRDARVTDLLASAGARLDADLRDDPEVRADLHRTIGVTYRSLTEFGLAEQHLRSALDLFRRARGENDLETVTSLYEFGSLKLIEGKATEAEPLLRRSLELRRKLLQKPDLVLAKNLGDLGTALVQGRGDVKTARSLYLEAWPIALAHLGPDHPGIAVALNNMAYIHLRAHDPASAEQALRRAVAIHERQPSLSYDYGVALSNLSTIIRASGRTSEAEPIARRAVDVVRATAGDPHIFLAGALNELGEVLCGEQRYDEAIAQVRTAMAMLDRLNAHGHPLYVQSTTVLGVALTGTGRLREAETTLRSAVDMARAVRNKRMLAIAEGALGECLLASRRDADAEPLLVDAEAMLRAGMGPDDPLTRQAGERLARLHAHKLAAAARRPIQR